MFIKNQQLGRKIQTRSEIAHKEREKQKQLRKWRKDNKARKIRKIKEKTALKRIKQLEIYAKINERPYITYDSGMSLYKDINTALIVMGYKLNHYSGALRRKLDKIMSIPIVIETYLTPKLQAFSEEFQSEMADLGYICNSMSKATTTSKTNYSYSVDGIYIMIYFAPPEKLGAYLLYTTGNENFFKRLCRYAMLEKNVIRKDGVYCAGELIASKTEKEIFDMLGLEYLEPEQRSFGVTDILETT